MSIASEITRLQTIKGAIRTKLNKMGLVGATADLADCRDAIEAIENRGSPAVTLTVNNPSVSVDPGYYSGGTVGMTLEEKTAVDNGVVTPSSGKVLSKVTVNVPAPGGWADVSGVTAVPGDVASPALYVGSDGNLTAGTMPNNGAVAASINPLDGHDTMSYTIPAGRHSGSGTVTITNDIETALAAI